MSCEVTWQIKYIMAPLVEETGHKLGRVLTYRNMLPPLKPHDLWIKRSTCGHMTVWKMYISAFKKCIYPLSRLKATKLRRDLRYIRMFSTQTLKSSLIVINFEQVPPYVSVVDPEQVNTGWVNIFSLTGKLSVYQLCHWRFS